MTQYYKNGWPYNQKSIPDTVRHYFNIKNDLVIDEGIIYYDSRIIIPYNLRKQVLQLLHESHLGITETKLRAKKLLYWPGIMNEIEQYITKCKICEKYRSQNIKDPLIPHEIPKLPYEKIAADIMTYNNIDYMITVDYYLKWIDIDKLKYKHSDEFILKFKNLFKTHGIPKLLIAHNMSLNLLNFKILQENGILKLKQAVQDIQDLMVLLKRQCI